MNPNHSKDTRKSRRKSALMRSDMLLRASDVMARMDVGLSGDEAYRVRSESHQVSRMNWMLGVGEMGGSRVLTRLGSCQSGGGPIPKDSEAGKRSPGFRNRVSSKSDVPSPAKPD